MKTQRTLATTRLILWNFSVFLFLVVCAADASTAPRNDQSFQPPSRAKLQDNDIGALRELVVPSHLSRHVFFLSPGDTTGWVNDRREKQVLVSDIDPAEVRTTTEIALELYAVDLSSSQFYELLQHPPRDVSRLIITHSLVHGKAPLSIPQKIDLSLIAYRCEFEDMLTFGSGELLGEVMRFDGQLYLSEIYAPALHLSGRFSQGIEVDDVETNSVYLSDVLVDRYFAVSGSVEGGVSIFNLNSTAEENTLDNLRAVDIKVHRFTTSGSLSLDMIKVSGSFDFNSVNVQDQFKISSSEIGTEQSGSRRQLTNTVMLERQAAIRSAYATTLVVEHTKFFSGLDLSGASIRENVELGNLTVGSPGIERGIDAWSLDLGSVQAERVLVSGLISGDIDVSELTSEELDLSETVLEGVIHTDRLRTGTIIPGPDLLLQQKSQVDSIRKRLPSWWSEKERDDWYIHARNGASNSSIERLILGDLFKYGTVAFPVPLIILSLFFSLLGVFPFLALDRGHAERRSHWMRGVKAWIESMNNLLPISVLVPEPDVNRTQKLNGIPIWILISTQKALGLCLFGGLVVSWIQVL